MAEANNSGNQQRQQLVGAGSGGCYEKVETAEDEEPKLQWTQRRCCCCGATGIVASLIAAAFVLGCLVSFAVTTLALTSPSSRIGRQSNRWIDDSTLKLNRDKLRGLVPNSALLDQHVAALSSRQSRAGTPGAIYHAEYVANNWRKLGLKVFNRTYSVLLSYLDTDSSTSKDQVGVRLCRGSLNGMDARCNVTLRLDAPITELEAAADALPSIVPFTKPLQGKFRLLTLEKLKETVAKATSPEQLRLALSDKVILGDRPVSAFINITVLNMTAGVLKNRAMESRPGVPVYPEGTGVPDTLISMKTTLNTNVKGDPTTPMFPSKPYAVRLEGGPPLSQPDHPTVPISKADVDLLNKALQSDSSSELFLQINWPMKQSLRPVQDICAELTGSVEPDRVVLVGGHRDAWHSGALDPHTGLSSLLEISRALAEFHSATGWRPRRSLLLCSWDAEEWNLIGSAEWLDEEILRANRRLVGYINTDTDIMGHWKVMVHAFRRWHGFLDKLFAEVPDPGKSTSSPDHHFYITPDSYSDYYVFWRNIGVPIVDLSYIRPNEPRMVVYDLYHSRYDTVRLYRLTDPGGKAHLAAVHNYIGIAYSLLDRPILPTNLTSYATEIDEAMSHLYQLAENASLILARGGQSRLNSSSWSALRRAFRTELAGAIDALRSFQTDKLDGGGTGSDLDLLGQRMLNDKLMEVQKVFVYRSIYPHSDVVNLLAEEGSLRVFRRIFRQEMHETHELIGFGGPGGGVGSGNGGDGSEAKQKNLEKLLETCILSLASVSKVLSDSFAT
ncbi:hypothetical protein BOX15_Mlig015731g1 [Macrostomum lignano]|uniref:Peptidase M28 domain-containing protein n=1 Tax=Macrostomum lignano TaxID=282301 RepID=A0A267EK18_9PLAT|nr:hypothetical protein BOX15_Mlig015731g1 [Macrostomum lignano]